MTMLTGSAPPHPRIRPVSAPQDRLGETPLWCGHSQTLFWLDIDGRKLQRLHPATGQVEVHTFDCRHAGSLALTFGARGGLFIGGGIVPRLGGLFERSEFRRRFEAKGRFEDYLREVPVLLVVDTLAALDGAAQALEQAAA